MSRLILPALLALAFVPSQELSTQYAPERGLRIEMESSFHVETIAFSLEVDGEPMDGGFGGAPTTAEERSITMIDTVLDAKDDVPSRVRREFESITSNSTTERGGEEHESERDCPLSGLTLELEGSGDDVSAEVVDGTAPDDESLLEGHALGLALDALLPTDEVDAGDSWSIEGEDLVRALGYDLESAYFPRPEPEEAGEGGGGHGPGGGRRRDVPSAGRFLSIGEWEVEATLGAEPEDHDGQACYVITIVAEASGDVPQPERGGPGRDRMDQTMLNRSLTTLRPDASFEAELEGKLYFSVEGRHPVHFEMSGEFGIESEREREMHGSQMVMTSVQEGEFKYSVDISPVAAE